MLWTLAVILFFLWALGVATAYTVSGGGFIQVLLGLAIALVLIRLIQALRPVS